MVWKSISGNYDKNRLAKPFQVAFRKELNEGWYLDKNDLKFNDCVWPCIFIRKKAE